MPIGEVLTPALGVLMSPLPIVAVILMLFSSRATTNGPAFVAGWVVGLVVVVSLVLILADPANLSSDGDSPSTAASVIQLVLGALLVLLAWRNWQKRPAPGETPEMPKWMAGVDKTTPIAAAGLGAFLAALNPKNLAFDIAAGTAIVSTGASTASQVAGAVVFVILASLGVAGPVVWYLVAPDKAAATLEKVRVWLVQNNTLIMAIVLLVLGVSQVGKGISGLFG